MNADCLFCKIIAGDIPSKLVHESETTYAFRDIHPQSRVHVIVVPRTHHEDVVALASDPPLLADVLKVGAEVARIEGIDQSGYRFVFNTGDHACRTVFHAHLHVLGGEQLAGFGR